MKIEILVPVATDFRNEDILKAACSIKHVAEIGIDNIKQGALSIECDYDVAFCSQYIVELAQQMEKDGADGIVLYCFAQPALAACKERLKIPVVGLSEAPIAIASVLGRHIGVIAPLEISRQQFSRAWGNKIEHINALELPILEYENLEVLGRALEERVKELVDRGCDVVILGCGSILGMDTEALGEKYQVAIIEPVHAAVSLCEYLIQAKLKQSKITYPDPPPKQVVK